MTEQNEVIPASEIRLGSLTVSGSSEVVQRASIIATELARIINERKLFTVIRRRKHVRVEGWTTLGSLLGVVPREVQDATRRSEDGTWEAWVELVRVSDGAVIGRGSAICSRDERNWQDRDEYALRSMAVTRATGKAFRLSFSWIIQLAGFEPTPFEEMPADTIEGEYRVPETDAGQHPGPTNGNGNGHERPLAPELLKELLHKKAAKYADTELTTVERNGKRGVIVNLLETTFNGEKKSRYAVTNYLFNVASTNELDDAQLLAVWDWLGATKENDTWLPDEHAIAEAQAALTAALKAEGQLELLEAQE